MIQLFWVYSGYGILALRLAVGAVMMAHGLPKLKDRAGTAQFLGSVGFKPAMLWATVVGLAEGLGGLLIVLGFFTQPVAAILAIQFVVILLTVKRDKPFVGGNELDWVLLAALIALATLGSGVVSLDSVLRVILF